MHMYLRVRVCVTTGVTNVYNMTKFKDKKKTTQNVTIEIITALMYYSTALVSAFSNTAFYHQS